MPKHSAKKNRWRTKEATLLLLSAAGGALGGLCAMRLFRHKTKHRRFSVGVPLMLAVQVVLVVYLMWYLK